MNIWPLEGAIGKKSKYQSYEVSVKNLPMGDRMSYIVDIDHIDGCADSAVEPARHGKMGRLLSSQALGKVLVLAHVCQGRGAQSPVYR